MKKETGGETAAKADSRCNSGMDDFLEVLRLAHKHGHITKQHLKTLRGQALGGNLEGAHKGLLKLLKQGK